MSNDPVLELQAWLEQRQRWIEQPDDRTRYLLRRIVETTPSLSKNPAGFLPYAEHKYGIKFKEPAVQKALDELQAEKDKG